MSRYGFVSPNGRVVHLPPWEVTQPRYYGTSACGRIKIMGNDKPFDLPPCQSCIAEIAKTQDRLIKWVAGKLWDQPW